MLESLEAPKRPPVPFLSERAWRLARVPAVRQTQLVTGGLLSPALRERFGIRWTRSQERQLRVLAAASRAATPLLPRSLRNVGPSYLRWRREAIARGEAGAARRCRQWPVGRAADMPPRSGPRAEGPGDAVSDRILDSALDLAAASGVEHLTMDAVARRARVGRMTVYRRFGDKQAWSLPRSARGTPLPRRARRAAGPTRRSPSRWRGLRHQPPLAREHPLLSRLAQLEPETC